MTTSLNLRLRSFVHRHLGLALILGAPLSIPAADLAKTFPTPEEAVSALAAAASTHSADELRVLFGATVEDLVNPDRVQATNDFVEFNTALNEAQRIVHESDSKCVLEVGSNHWPFPIPLVKKASQWSFDTEAGREEILSRRIGKNELATLRVMRAYVEAQREYASKDRDGDEVLEYAQKFTSNPGRKDGLFWPEELDGEISPLGPLMAQAQSMSYDLHLREEGAAPEPYQGYFFKILTRQAKSAPGGKYDYVINGNMIGGFALVAWPAEYGESGIMTFMVNQQGRVYQKNLGPKTASTISSMKAYDPDKTWTISQD